MQHEKANKLMFHFIKSSINHPTVDINSTISIIEYIYYAHYP